MKFKCPKCSVSFKCSDSRYNLWRCEDCGHSFRGIHCEANMVDYWLHQVPFLPGFYSWDRSYNLQSAKGGPNFTRCPHCYELIRGFNGSGSDGVWPTVCSHCCTRLNTSHYQPAPKPESKPKPSPKPEKGDPSPFGGEPDAKPDYKKLMDLINRL